MIRMMSVTAMMGNTAMSRAAGGRSAVRLLSDAAGFGKAAALILLAAVIVLILLKVIWGREPDNRTQVEYYPPEGIDPLDAAYIIDGYVDRNDTLALFFYLSSRGYMTITEYLDEDGERQYSFEALDFPVSESQGVQSFFRALFDLPESSRAVPSGDAAKVCLSDARQRMKKNHQKLQRSVRKSYRGKRSFFSKSSRGAEFAGTCVFLISLLLLGVVKEWGRTNTYTRSIFTNGVASQWQIAFAMVLEILLPVVMVISIPSLAALYRRVRTKRSSGKLFGTAALAVLYVVAAIWYMEIICFGPNGFGNESVTTLLLILLCAAPFIIGSMRSRSQWNSTVNSRFGKFREFMENADEETLRMLMAEDPEYFFAVMPYAYLFGMTKRWARNFQEIDVSYPKWFKSDIRYKSGQVFDVVTMSSMIRNLENAYFQE